MKTIMTIFFSLVYIFTVGQPSTRQLSPKVDFSDGQKSQYDSIAPEIILNEFVLKNRNSESNQIIELIMNYHKKMFLDWQHLDEFWTNETEKNYALPDYMLIQEFAEYWNYKIVPNVINIFMPGDYYTAQIGYNLFKNNKYKGVFCVYTFAIKKENNSFKFFPIIETYKFKLYKNNDISLYLKDTTINGNYLLDSLNSYNIKLSKLFNVESVKFKCYKFNTFSELNQCIGLDVQRNYSRAKKNAYCDAFNKIIYATDDDTYFHELVHMYTGTHFSKTKHSWIDEGLATYLGGSGVSLENHLENLSKELKSHKGYDLNNFLDYENRYITNASTSSTSIATSYKFTIGGLICKLVYEKHGFDGIKKLLLSGPTNNDLYLAVENLLSISRSNFDSYFREEIYKYD